MKIYIEDTETEITFSDYNENYKHKYYSGSYYTLVSKLSLDPDVAQAFVIHNITFDTYEIFRTDIDLNRSIAFESKCKYRVYPIPEKVACKLIVNFLSETKDLSRK